MNVQVMIVGRGPIGMTLALRLAQQGVCSTIIDEQGRDNVNPGSKAVLVSGHVIDVLWPTGVGQEILREGLSWTTSRTFIRGHEVASVDVTPKEGHLPNVVNLPQQRVEELLLERLLGEPRVTLIPDATVEGVVETNDSVQVSYRTQDGQIKRAESEWLAACDGARSTVRKLLNIPFEGYGHSDNFLIADIAADLPFPSERHFHFDPPYNPGRTVLIHPQPGSTWHIDWQVGHEVDAQEELAAGRVHQRLRNVLGDRPFEIQWLTTYSFKQLRARTFRKGRTFLVGDAAHLTSPYGARGMNSGIADAEALAWRLVMAVSGTAQPSILDSYAEERQFAASENLRITGHTARFMCPTTPAERVRQRATLTAARWIPALRGLVDSGKFYEAPQYAPSDVIQAASSTSGVEPGRLAPDAVVQTQTTGVARLRELLRTGIVCMWHDAGDTQQAWANAEALIAEFPTAAKVTVILVSDASPASRGQVNQIRDPSGEILSEWFAEGGENAVYIIRPDAYVAARVPLSKSFPLDAAATLARQCFTLYHPLKESA